MDTLFEGLLPYRKWRRGQREIAEATYRAIKGRKILLVSYPTGGGKTLATLIGSLAATLEEDLRIIYLARTRNQFQAPLRELRKLRRTLRDLGYAVLFNKRDMCLIGGLSKLDYEEFVRYCTYLISRGACPYYKVARSLNVESFPRLADVYDMVEIGRKSGACPYELSKKLASEADVIIAAYNYLLDPAIREYFLRDLSIDLGEAVLIVDEVHNLPRVVTDILTKELRRSWIRESRREIRRFYRGRDREHVLESLAKLNWLINRLGGRATGTRYTRLGPEELLSVAPSPSRLLGIAGIIEREQSSGLPPVISYTRKVGEFLREAFFSSYRRMLVIDRSEIYPVLKLVPTTLNSRTFRIFRDSKASILMSGTLPPTEYLALVLGINGRVGEIEELRLPSPFGGNVRLLALRNISSRYLERTEENFRRMAGLIDKVYSAIPSGVVLTVFPSYDFMKSVRAYLRSTPLCVERRDTKLRDIIGFARKHSKLLLLSVAWGKIVEGIEIVVDGKSLVSAIVIAGLPVPEPGVIEENSLKILSMKIGDRDLAWKHVYLSPAAIRVLQAIGRGVRSERDRVLVILLDERMLDEYVRNIIEGYGYKIEETEDRELTAHVRKFFRGGAY